MGTEDHGYSGTFESGKTGTGDTGSWKIGTVEHTVPGNVDGQGSQKLYNSSLKL